MKQGNRLLLSTFGWGILTLALSSQVAALSLEKVGEEENFPCPIPDTSCPTASLESVTSVSELSDIKPTDWAYQALQSLIQRYGVMSGYPDGTFRGNRAMTRYEFAAALNRVLEKIESLRSNDSSNQIIEEDLVTLRRLQRDYRFILEDLRDRASALDTTVTKLEAQNFSTTSKLQGEAIIALTDGNNASATMVSRVRLNLITSFKPGDLLFTQLEGGNNGGDAVSRAHQQGQNLLGTEGILADGGGLDYIEVDPQVRLNRLYYTFRPQRDIAIAFGAKMHPRDFIDRNRFANNEAVDFSSSFFINNPLIVQNQIDRFGGAGAALAWNLGGGAFTLRSLYIGTDANLVDGGLFGDSYQGSLELEYSPNKNFALRLQYTNAEINNTDIQAGGINLELALNRNLGVFARYGYGNYKGFNTLSSTDVDLQPHTWAVGVALRNWLIPGTMAGMAVGQPFVESNLGNASQTNFEAFYNLALNDNYSITPSLILVTNPNNNSANETVWQGTLRTVFQF